MAQAIGRVQPIYRGTYTSSTVYYKLDHVIHNGATWVCQTDGISYSEPNMDNPQWQLVAAKGDQGIQGPPGSLRTVTAEATTLEPNSSAWVSVYPGGDETERDYHFEFGIPVGQIGFTDVGATASATTAGTPPSVIATVSASGTERILNFDFKIPSADGEGAKSVDGVYVSGGAIALGAIRYNVDQTAQGSWYIDPNARERARLNIGAQPIGDYIAATGATMVGDFQIKSNNLTDNQSIGADASGLDLQFTDANDAVLAKIEPNISANRVQSIDINAHRVISNVHFNNSLSLGLDSSGNSVVSVSNASAWRSALNIAPAASTAHMASDTSTQYGIVGESLAYARQDHAHPLNVSAAAPIKDGTAAAGDSTAYARANHVHPLNTSDATPSADGVATAGDSTAYARANHRHPLNVATSGTPVKDGTAALGTAATYARSDHVHPLNVDTTVPAALGTAATGSATTYARRDHVHALPAITSLSGTLAVAHGGTGASSTDAARTALGVTAAPTVITVSVTSNGTWTSASTAGVVYWTQPSLTISGGTSKSIIDLKPSAAVLCQMVKDGIASIYVLNNNGDFSVVAIDGKPTANLSISATRTETL